MEFLEEPGFWILSALGVGAILIGYIISNKMELVSIPIWQVLVLIVGVIGASAFFSMQD